MSIACRPWWHGNVSHLQALVAWQFHFVGVDRLVIHHCHSLTGLILSRDIFGLNTCY